MTLLDSNDPQNPAVASRIETLWSGPLKAGTGGTSHSCEPGVSVTSMVPHAQLCADTHLAPSLT